MANVQDDPLVMCLIDSHHGVFIPQLFAESFDLPAWGLALSADDMQHLKNGPADEYYWDIWDYVLNNAKHTHEGVTWTLHHDGDLFAIHENYGGWEE